MDIPTDRVRIAFLPRRRVEGRARRADRRHDRRRPLPREQGRGLPPRLLRGRRTSPRRCSASRSTGIELIDSAPRRGRRGPGRVPPPALVPRGARRADRGAGRPVVDQPGFHREHADDRRLRGRHRRRACRPPARAASSATRPAAGGSTCGAARKCGHVGCCDSSPSQHASRHAADIGHPIVHSYEPGEDWFWSYVDRRGSTTGPELAPPLHHPLDQTVPGPSDRVPEDWQDHLH